MVVGQVRGNPALRSKALLGLVIHNRDSGTSSQGSAYIH
jgi:hypothetical protein